MSLLFWACIALLAFAFALYPLLMAVVAKVAPQPLSVTPGQSPAVQVLLVVHNGAGGIRRKLENLLSLDYPAQSLQVLVACDGCSDDTAEIARSLGDPRVIVHAYPQRRGKSACLADLIEAATALILVFNDLRQMLAADAVRQLVDALSDPAVGAAGGQLVLGGDSNFARGIGSYWKHESWVRSLESASGSVVGMSGALYAAKRDAIGKVPAGIILDDMWIPATIAARGLRLVHVPTARAIEPAVPELATESQRKRRTLAGNFQLLHRWPALAIPGAHPLALRLWGHKWLRLAAPWLLLTAFVICAILALRGERLYQALFALQIAAYALALSPFLWKRLASLRLVRLCWTFLTLNTSAAFALFDYLRHRDGHLWQSATQPEPSR